MRFLGAHTLYREAGGPSGPPASPRDTALMRLRWREMLPGPERSLRAITDTELLVHRGEVRLDGAFGDAEPSGDLLVRQSRRHELQHLGLASAQPRCRLPAPLRFQQNSGRFRIERRAARLGGAYRS